mgnify:CR=1 FL=1
MSTINDTDLFLVNRAGSSYKTTASNISSATDTDLFLVTRAGSSYKVAKSDVDDIADTDLLLCDRAGSSYKVSGADFKGLFTSVTNGTFSPSCDNPGSTGSSVHNFLQSSSCTANYITADGDYSLVTFHGTTDLKVSVNDVVSIRCCTGSDASNRDLWMLIDSTYYKCSGGLHGASWDVVCSSGQWKDTTVTVNGNFVGLKGTGVSPGGGGDIGLGQMKINGDLIYNGSTYETGIN